MVIPDAANYVGHMPSYDPSIVNHLNFARTSDRDRVIYSRYYVCSRLCLGSALRSLGAPAVAIVSSFLQLIETKQVICAHSKHLR
jgi:hypothetical protein